MVDLEGHKLSGLIEDAIQELARQKDILIKRKEHFKGLVSQEQQKIEDKQLSLRSKNGELQQLNEDIFQLTVQTIPALRSIQATGGFGGGRASQGGNLSTLAEACSKKIFDQFVGSFADSTEKLDL
jgi:hypothetical protein